METTLLATKLFVPPAARGLLGRPRLLLQLQGILNHPLTLVSAPAGFSKTTIITQWIRSCDPPIPTGWLSLDESENDPPKFWNYLIVALGTACPGIGKTVSSRVTSPQPLQIESFLTPLINEVAAVESDFVLVLDDYHLINTETIHRGIRFLLEHAPGTMHLVILTRADPPLPLAGFRGNGTLLEIRGDQLRFTADEATVLLAQLGAPELEREEIGVLHSKTEGWVVGLKMAALSLRGERNVSAFIGQFAGTQRYILDYLVEEVLQRQPPQMRRFLLQTSIVERLSGPLCDTLMGGTSGHDMLLTLESGNLFLVPLDGYGEWFRYHHLFRDLLQHQLEQEFDKETRDNLHRKASSWYEGRGLLEEAIDHALAAREWPRAMALIREPAVITRKLRTLTLLKWLKRVPELVLRTDLALYHNYTWALIAAGDYKAVDDCLVYLDTMARDDGLMQGKIAVARSTIAFNTGDISLAKQHAERALSLLHDSDKLSQDYKGNLGVVCLLLAGIHISEVQFVEAEPLLEQSLQLFRQAGYVAGTIHQLTYLGLIASSRGELSLAFKLFQEAVEVTQDDPFIAITHLWLGNLYYEWNDLENAAYHQELATQFPQSLRSQVYVSLDQAYYLIGRTRTAMGDADAALKALDHVRSLGAENRFDHVVQLRNAARDAAIALMKGDAESASRWADDIRSSELLPPMEIPITSWRFALARKGQAIESEEMREAYQRFERQGLRVAMISMRICQALDPLGSGSRLGHIAEALAMGKPGGLIRTFVDFGVELIPLLRQAISAGIEPEYARKLLVIVEAEEKRRQTVKARGMRVPQSSEFLSLRELEVLGLAAEGLSNRQIAEKVTVSLNTVKTHMRNITQKLGARSRTETIARARVYKLI